MSSTAVLLVLLSAVAHAYWNFLLKRGGGTNLFLGLSKVGEVVMFAPLFIAVLLGDVARLTGLFWLAVVGAFFVLANYVFLAWAYRHGDLSFVYPIARGSILLFLPFLGYLVMGERVSAAGAVALALIVTGILALQLPALRWAALAQLGPRLRSPATAFALLAAFAAACYTLWDKHAVQRVPAFAYMYAYTVFTAIAYAAFVWRRYPRDAIRVEWTRNRGPILQVGFFNIVSYLLVLVALRTGTSSYVIAVRQASIAFGVALGWTILREAVTAPKRVGVALIVAGCVMVGAAG